MKQIATTSTLLFTLAAFTFAGQVGRDLKSAGTDVKDATVTGAKKTAHGTKTAYNKTKSGVKKGTHKTAAETEKGANKVANKTSDTSSK